MVEISEEEGRSACVNGADLRSCWASSSNIAKTSEGQKEASQLRFKALVGQDEEILRSFCAELGLAEMGEKAELASRILESLYCGDQGSDEHADPKEVRLSIPLLWRMLADRPKVFIVIEVPGPPAAAATDVETGTWEPALCTAASPADRVATPMVEHCAPPGLQGVAGVHGELGTGHRQVVSESTLPLAEASWKKRRSRRTRRERLHLEDLKACSALARVYRFGGWLAAWLAMALTASRASGRSLAPGVSELGLLLARASRPARLSLQLRSRVNLSIPDARFLSRLALGLACSLGGVCLAAVIGGAFLGGSAAGEAGWPEASTFQVPRENHRTEALSKLPAEELKAMCLEVLSPSRCNGRKESLVRAILVAIA